MEQVFNWQLGRSMSFPQEGAKRPQRQFAAVFNLNRCVGCQTCTMACKSTWTFLRGQEAMWWNNVETKPFGGYPRGWDQKALELLGPQPGWDQQGIDSERSPYGVYQGKTLFEAVESTPGNTGKKVLGYLPDRDEWKSPNACEDTPNRYPDMKDGRPVRGSELPEHETFFFYLARICNHCTYPACLAACPRKAIYKRPEDGLVLIDQNRCRGYQKCVEACPYKKAMFNYATETSEKCIGCYPRLEGKDPEFPEEPVISRCMSACIGKIRLQGWVDDPKSPVYHLVKERVALPLYPQFGTEPNIYYIPPRWAPRGYLKQMFGPAVEEALEKYREPSHELLGILQLFGTTRALIESYRIEEEEAVGYDGKGNELVRVPFHEPTYIRSSKHLNIT